MPQVACRMIQLSLEHGICQDSVTGFTICAAVLCQQSKEIPIMRQAYRIGKIALSLLKQKYSSELVPRSYALYYGFVANNFEPFQLCADRLQKGFEGM